MRPLLLLLPMALVIARTARGQDSAMSAGVQNDRPAAACKQLMSFKRSKTSAHYRYGGAFDPAYVRSVFEAIYRQWERPAFTTERTDLRVLLTRAQPAQLFMTKPSTSAAFDLEAERAVALAATQNKLPPLPTDSPGDSLWIDLSFGDVAALIDSTPVRTGRRQAPEPLVGNDKPRAPFGYRANGPVRVTLEFEIDTLGLIDRKTIQVIASPHQAYTQAVLDVLPQWRFSPAVEDCRKVRSPYSWTTTFGPS